MRYAWVCLLCVSALAPAATVPRAASRDAPRDTSKEVELRAERLFARVCDALLALQERKPGALDATRGAIECRTTNPVPHGYHTRAGEAVFPFAVRFQRTGRYLDETLALGDWLVDQQQPDGSWVESPHSWWGTTAHQSLALAAATQILGPVLGKEEQKARRDKWYEACRRASDFLVVKVRPGDVPLCYLPTAACALRLAAQLKPVPTWEAHAATLVEETLRAANDEGLFVEEGRAGFDAGITLGQTIPMLALYAILAGDDRLGARAARAARDYLAFLWSDGSVDATWGVRIQRWIFWGTFGTYGPAAGFALLAPRDPVFREAADRNLRLLDACCLKSGIVGYGPHAAEHERAQELERQRRAPTATETAALPAPSADAICIYPTVNAAVGLAIALQWGELAGPTAPLPHETQALCRVFNSAQAAVVHTGGVSTSFSWSSLDIPGVYQPRGGAITHLLWADRGTLQCATPSLYVRPESLHLPRQPGIASLTPRVEFHIGDRWYSNVFDRSAVLESHEDELRRFVFRGTFCDFTGKSSEIEYRLTYEIERSVLRKTLEIKGQGAHQGTRVIEPFVLGPAWNVFRAPDGLTLSTNRGSFVVRLLEPRTGVVIEWPTDPPKAYFPLLPAVRTLPVQLRFLEADVRVARWEIERAP